MEPTTAEVIGWAVLAVVAWIGLIIFIKKVIDEDTSR